MLLSKSFHILRSSCNVGREAQSQHPTFLMPIFRSESGTEGTAQTSSSLSPWSRKDCGKTLSLFVSHNDIAMNNHDRIHGNFPAWFRVKERLMREKQTLETFRVKSQKLTMHPFKRRHCERCLFLRILKASVLVSLRCIETDLHVTYFLFLFHFLFFSLATGSLSSPEFSNPFSNIQTTDLTRLALNSVPLFSHPVPCLAGVLGGVSAPKLPTSSGLPSGILIGKMRRGAAETQSQERWEGEVGSGERARAPQLPGLAAISTSCTVTHACTHTHKDLCINNVFFNLKSMMQNLFVLFFKVDFF